MSLITGPSVEGGPTNEATPLLVINDDGSAAMAVTGPATVGGTDVNRALVSADGALSVGATLTVDSVTATDVTIKGTINPDGSGTSYNLVVNSEGQAYVYAVVQNPGAGLDALIQRQTNAGTISSSGSARSVTVVVLAGNPLVDGTAVPAGVTLSWSIDMPGDFLYSVTVVCAAGDDVLLTQTVLD